MNGFTKTLQMLLWLQDKGLGMGNNEDPREHPNRTTDPESNNRKTRKPSFKRGLTAEAIVIATEDPLQFDLLRATVEQQFSPRPGVEQELVDRLAGLLWRLRRAPTLEAAVIQARDAQQTEANKVPAPDGPEGNLGLAIIKDSEQDTLGKLCRYENALMNAMAKNGSLAALASAPKGCNEKSWPSPRSGDGCCHRGRSGCAARTNAIIIVNAFG